MKYLALITTTLLTLVIAATGFAADDPSIKGRMRTDIQAAMSKHVEEYSVEGRYAIYDTIKGELKWLKLQKLHDGIVKKGDFYVSCADFVDLKGKQYDIDFLVAKDEGSYRVLESVVHAEAGKKRKYHLED